MSQFSFRLQKVLEYRELEEKWAKDNYLACQVARVEAEQELDEIARSRDLIVQEAGNNLDARLNLELQLSALHYKEELTRSIILRLLEDEEVARGEWILKKQDTGVLEKLREKAYKDWEHQELLKEQAMLDEWATQRRKPAQLGAQTQNEVAA